MDVRRGSLAGAVVALALLVVTPPACADDALRAGAAVVDGTYHVGSSAGQYASVRTDGAYGDVDPNFQSVKNQASYGVQSREKVRALVLQRGAQLVAIVTDDHYVPQDALWRRTAQLLAAETGGRIGEHNLVMPVAHNHSSPSYSSLDWGVWTFQDVFDFRFFDYYARQNAAAVEQALDHLHRARVSATASYFDKFQRNPMGPGVADDGTPDGFPQSFTDHDLSVVRVDDVDDAAHPQPLATLVNIGQHPEMLEGYDLISGEFPETMARFVDRATGGVTLFTQNATGTSEVERDSYHSIHERELFDHAQYAQMEWGARQLADAVLADWQAIGAQRPDADRASHFGMTPYHDRFVPWTTDAPLAMEDRWFPGPVSHPSPGVSSCRTDPTLGGNPRLPLLGLPDCVDVPVLDGLTPVTGPLGVASPGLTTDDLEALGIPVPENVSFPSTGALEDTAGVHLQAIRLGDVLLTICSCEQWVDQAYDIKTRTDRVPGNQWLGYDWSAQCTQNADRTWTCPTSPKAKLPDALIQHMRAQVLNDAAGWDDPTCAALGCGLQAESEPTDVTKIRGNYTHDDTTLRGGADQTAAYAAAHGYVMTIPVSMANDYNGYIATYREYMDHDHYRKALTGWGPHSSDYLATRLVRMGHALHGDGAAAASLDAETDVAKAPPAYAPGAAKEAADQEVEEAKVTAVGQAASAGVIAYGATLPDDGGSDTAVVQPHDIPRFDQATFTWDGGNTYTDDPVVTVERRARGGAWVPFADQSGEVPVTVRYPAADLSGAVSYRAGGQVWKWTASFEAYVSRFGLIDLRGRTYRATPAGDYRFVVHGTWRRGGTDAGYSRVSAPFAVRPWDGITVEDARISRRGRLTFGAGPAHVYDEARVRHTEAKDFGVLHVRVGPVDFPDMARAPKAGGARFLTHVRGYSATSPTDLESYCLDCRFRDWLDATNDLRATVVVGRRRGCPRTVEHLASSSAGHFALRRRLRRGDRVRIIVRDAWGDVSGTPAFLRAGRTGVRRCGGAR